MEQGADIPGPHVGGCAIFFLSGRRGRNPPAAATAGISDSRAENGGLGWTRMPRLSIKSLWMPKAARTAQVPVPVGSQARPTRGCSNSLAWFSSMQDFAIIGLVWIAKPGSYL